MNADVGTFKHLPPTLLAQHHFPLNGFKPYVGAGVNYTRFSSVDLARLAGAKIGEFKVDPLLFGVGLGLRF